MTSPNDTELVDALPGSDTLPERDDEAGPASPADPALPREAAAPSGRPPSRRWSSEWWAPAAGLLVVVALVVVPTWPGRINNDTVGMITEMESGEILDWHAWLLQVLWRPFYALGVGVGAILLVQVVVFFLAIHVVVLRIVGRPVMASSLAVGICLYPTTYALLMTVTRDVWFLCFWLSALAVVCSLRSAPRLRLALVVVGALLSYAARQNGLAVAPVLLYAGLDRWPWGARARLGVLWRSAGAVVLTAAIFLVMVALQPLTGVRHSAAASVTPLFDLARLSVRDGTMKIPDVANPQGLTLEEVASLSTPYVDDHLYTGDRQIKIRLTEQEEAVVLEAWKDEILADPVDYLRMRWKLFARQVGWSGETRLAYVPDEIANPFGIRPRFPALSARSTAYLQTFNAGPTWTESGPVHRAWPALGLMAVAMGLALRRRRGAPIVLVAGLSSVSYGVSVFFLAPELHSRMISPSTVVALVAATGLLVPWQGAAAPAVDGAPRTTDEDPPRAGVGEPEGVPRALA